MPHKVTRTFRGGHENNLDCILPSLGGEVAKGKISRIGSGLTHYISQLRDIPSGIFFGESLLNSDWKNPTESFKGAY